MKKEFALFAAAFTCCMPATAAENWLESNAGTAKADHSFLKDDGGMAIGIAAAYAFNDRFYLRADLWQDRWDFIQPAYAFGSDPNNPIEVPEQAGEDARTLSAVTGGYAHQLTDNIAISGEIGVARLKREFSHVAVAVDSNNNPVFQRFTDSYTETTPILRLGINGKWRKVTLGAGISYFDTEPSVMLDPNASDDASTWTDFRAGYQLSERWNLGVQYRDSEDFASTTASVRWNW